MKSHGPVEIAAAIALTCVCVQPLFAQGAASSATAGNARARCPSLPYAVLDAWNICGEAESVPTGTPSGYWPSLEAFGNTDVSLLLRLGAEPYPAPPGADNPCCYAGWWEVEPQQSNPPPKWVLDAEDHCLVGDDVGCGVVFRPMSKGTYSVSCTSFLTGGTAGVKVRVYTVIDVAMQDLPEETPELGDGDDAWWTPQFRNYPNETNPGAFIWVNNDNDDGKPGIDKDWVQELEEPDPDLTEVTFVMDWTPDIGTVTVSKPPGTRLWSSARKKAAAPTTLCWHLDVEGERNAFINEFLATTWWLEATEALTGPRQVKIYYNRGDDCCCSDAVNVTIGCVDLDPPNVADETKEVTPGEFLSANDDDSNANCTPDHSDSLTAKFDTDDGTPTDDRILPLKLWVHPQDGAGHLTWTPDKINVFKVVEAPDTVFTVTQVASPAAFDSAAVRAGKMVFYVEGKQPDVVTVEAEYTDNQSGNTDTDTIRITIPKVDLDGDAIYDGTVANTPALARVYRADFVVF